MYRLCQAFILNLSAFFSKQVQSLQPQHLIQQQADGTMISFVTSTGQTHHVSAANHHIDLHQGKTFIRKILKTFCAWLSDVAKMPTIVTVAVLTLADVTPIQTISLNELCCLRKSRQ